MAKRTNFGFEKRQKEMARKRKQEEKQQRKLEKKKQPGEEKTGDLHPEKDHPDSQ